MDLQRLVSMLWLTFICTTIQISNYPLEHLTITWRKLPEAVHRAGHVLKANIGPFDVGSPPVIAIFAPYDGLIYTTTQLAILIGLIVSLLF